MDNAKLTKIIGPVVEDLGFELWGCQYVPQARSAVLRIYIDNDKGVTAGDCQKVSRQVDAVLSVEGLLNGQYFLEVSSPGIERLLFNKTQFERYIGQLIKVSLHQLVDGQRNFKATLKSVDENEIMIETEGKSLSFCFGQIKKAKLIEQ